MLIWLSRKQKRRYTIRPYVTVKGKPRDTRTAPTVTVSKKYGTIVFSKGCIDQLGMAGKFVKLFYEPTKRVIGWQVRDRIDQNEMKLWKLCKPAKAGTWVMGVKRMLDEFNGALRQQSYPGLEVQRYREMGPLDEYSGQTFFFVEVKAVETNN